MRRAGVPRLVYRPNDHDETFLAESAVDEPSLGPEIRSLRGLTLKFYGAQPTPCEARVTDFKAIAWVMPQRPPLTWDELPEGPVAEAAFERGNIYVVGVATATGTLCSNTSWAVTGDLDVRFEEAQSLDPASQPDTIKGEPSLPYLAAWDTAYSRLRASSTGGKLPARWHALPSTTRIWGFVGSPLASLRIVNFERNVTPELLGRSNEPGKPWFSRGGVAVWKIADAEAEFIGPRGSVLDDSEDLLAVTAIHVNRQPPLLSLTSSRHLTTLRRIEANFEIAEELSMAPAR